MSSYTDCLNAKSYANKRCRTKEQARIRHIHLIKKGVSVVDPSSAAEWAALEAAGDAIIIRNIRGEYDGGAAQEAEGFGDVQTEITGMNHQLTITDANGVDNIDFYNDIKNKAGNYELFMVGETKIFKTNSTFSLAPTLPITANLSDSVNVVAVIKWSYEDLPVTFVKPSAGLYVVN